MKETELPNFIRPYTPKPRKSVTHIRIEPSFRTCERMREALLLAAHSEPLGKHSHEYRDAADWLLAEMLND
tara:strand:+ start:300 stop:512 length:213 start_codon:yes stop_codon:yes gene_type:complete